ncbi:MAG: hypothetical protein M4579_001073 [Chaenotheca gracillima]|nr:MAG: hypothetical protein M4579_001073 [Chaenotheca gracillima]
MSGYPVLRSPFSYVSRIGGGGSGTVYGATANIAAKVPYRFDRAQRFHQQLSESGIEECALERKIYSSLASTDGRILHPHIVQFFLDTEDDPDAENAFLIERMEKSLKARIEEGVAPLELQYRWIKQITKAVVFLEQRGLYHCDLRPANILLDGSDNVKLCDFTNARDSGEPMPGATEPFYRVGSDSPRPAVGPATEQFAIGSTIYNIRKGEEPPEYLCDMGQRPSFTRDELLSLANDDVFGQVIQRCWHAEFDTLAQVEEAVSAAIVQTGVTVVDEVKIMDLPTFQARISECKVFLEEQKPIREDLEERRKQREMKKASMNSRSFLVSMPAALRNYISQLYATPPQRMALISVSFAAICGTLFWTFRKYKR